jgi:hypothetical protein
MMCSSFSSGFVCTGYGRFIAAPAGTELVDRPLPVIHLTYQERWRAFWFAGRMRRVLGIQTMSH